jgi:hypothetical protein
MESFQEFIKTNLIFESLDTSYNILKTEGNEELKRYYFNIDDKEYRIFIETQISGDHTGLHVGFERKISNEWTTKGQTGDLSQKEALTLFGTVYKLIKGIRFYSISLRTPEAKKGALYFRMLNTLQKKLGKGEVVQDDVWLYIYSEEPLNKPTRPDRTKFNWKYKSNK